MDRTDTDWDVARSRAVSEVFSHEAQGFVWKSGRYSFQPGSSLTIYRGGSPGAAIPERIEGADLVRLSVWQPTPDAAQKLAAAIIARGPGRNGARGDTRAPPRYGLRVPRGAVGTGRKIKLAQAPLRLRTGLLIFGKEAH